MRDDINQVAKFVPRGGVERRRHKEVVADRRNRFIVRQAVVFVAFILVPPAMIVLASQQSGFLGGYVFAGWIFICFPLYVLFATVLCIVHVGPDRDQDRVKKDRRSRGECGACGYELGQVPDEGAKTIACPECGAVWELSKE